ncbi:hypothetical protein SASPL_105398 [Salvia splendens]|uniref:Ion transport domain-containing protein n=1 Tax=Salvia splendens TaxID=180675 RepID=A0A8X9AAQ2_SALSN|nr:hypothetical protein SASPL_105398 [Salvia splendens]
MEKNLRVNYALARWFKLIAVAVFSINCAACIFYLLVAYNDDPSNTWIAKVVPLEDNFRQLSLGSRDITSMYWSVTIFSTIGFGDLQAVNSNESLTCLIVMFVDCGVGAYVTGNVPLKEYGLLGLIRLWRLKRVYDVFARMEKNLCVNYALARWFKLIAVAVFSINRAACIFYLLVAYNDDPSNTWIAKVVPLEDNFRQLSLGSRYIISMYWSVTIFSTIGFGDL